jgi:hypothetical protein
MFHKGECIRSRFYGLGQALEDGDEPMVRFLDGRKRRVTRETAAIIPEDQLVEEIEKRTAFELYSTLWVYGSAWLQNDGVLWVRDAEGIWRGVNELMEEDPPPDGTPFFLSEETGATAREVPPDAPRGGPNWTKCVVRRVIGGQLRPQPDDVAGPQERPLRLLPTAEWPIAGL